MELEASRVPEVGQHVRAGLFIEVALTIGAWTCKVVVSSVGTETLSGRPDLGSGIPRVQSAFEIEGQPRFG